MVHCDVASLWGLCDVSGLMTALRTVSSQGEQCSLAALGVTRLVAV